MCKSSENKLKHYDLFKYNDHLKKYLVNDSDNAHTNVYPWWGYENTIHTFLKSYYGDVTEDVKIKIHRSIEYALALAAFADEVVPNVSQYIDTTDLCYDKNKMRILLSSLREMPEKIFWREMAVHFEPIGWTDDPPYDNPHFLTDVQNFLDFCSIPIKFERVELREEDLLRGPAISFPHQWWAYQQSPCETCPKAKDKR